jgi:acetyl-CoA carboxylase biotin carboxyl carrier protein
LDLKELKEILQILDEKEIAEFELEEEGMKLRIRKAAPVPPLPAAVVPAAIPTPPAPPASVLAVAPAAPITAGSPAANAAGAAGPPVEEGVALVRSPIVGTFYRSPDPNSPPFVSAGDRVKVGQVLCIVEAMKLMNEIESEMAGEVVKVHRENGEPVQYGEPLFSIRTE